MRLQFMLSEMVIGLRRNLSMTVSLVLVTMVSLVFFGFGLLSSMQVNEMKDFWYDKVEVWIVLCPARSLEPSCATGEVTQAQKDQLSAAARLAEAAGQDRLLRVQGQAYDHFVAAVQGLGDQGQRHARPDAGDLPGQADRPEEVRRGRQRLRGRARASSRCSTNASCSDTLFYVLNRITIGAWSSPGP